MKKSARQHEQESIAARFMDFLKLHPPFQGLDADMLLKIVNASQLSLLAQGEQQFQQGQPAREHIYMVRKGTVLIETGEELIDRCAQGEIFGARALLENENYQAGARAEEDSLILKIQTTALRELAVQHPFLLEYFFGDFSSGVALRKRKLAEIAMLPALDKSMQGSVPINARARDLCIAETSSVADVARKMKAKNASALVLIDSRHQPKGILTESDFRDFLAGDHADPLLPAAEIMSSPVHCVKPGGEVDFYLLEMLRQNVRHLCLVNSKGQFEGLVSNQDLLVEKSSSATALISRLKRCRSREEISELTQRWDQHLRKLLEAEQPIDRVAALNQVFNREVLRGIMALRKSGHDTESFCWIALGSTGRGEQILRTDFDSAIIYDENKAEASDLLALAKDVQNDLEFTGFHSDSAGIQANNPEWICSLAEWKEKFNSWIDEPTEQALLHATIFFDLMPFYGNFSLAEELQQFLGKLFKGNPRYAAFLTQNALRNPAPLGFFNNFLLEKSGDHRDTFDIKARAMMPLADAARLLALENGVLFPSGTLERFGALRKKLPHLAGRLEDAATAYEIFMKIRAEAGYRQNDDGRYVEMEDLSNLEKQIMKNAFRPVSDMQHIIR